ncbi:MAG TPA: hypothetical protein VH413_08500 [Verrucomicrobiae bacterium]|nr:hypothetical protein [Verrucomicrobiae bacterium]
MFLDVHGNYLVTRLITGTGKIDVKRRAMVSIIFSFKLHQKSRYATAKTPAFAAFCAPFSKSINKSRIYLAHKTVSLNRLIFKTELTQSRERRRGAEEDK